MPKRSKNDFKGKTIKQKYKETHSKGTHKSASSSNPNRKVGEKEGMNMRSKNKIKVLNMYRDKPDM